MDELIVNVKLKTKDKYQQQFLKNESVKTTLRYYIDYLLSNIGVFYYIDVLKEKKEKCDLMWTYTIQKNDDNQDGYKLFKKSIVQQWEKWDGEIVQTDLYLFRNIPENLGRLDGTELTLEIILNQKEVSKETILYSNSKQIKIKWIYGHDNELVAPNFKLTKFRLDDSVNGIFLYEHNSLWDDNLMNITIHYQMPLDKFFYQSFNLLHFLEHCLAIQYKTLDNNGSTNLYGNMNITFTLKEENFNSFAKKFSDQIKNKNIYSKIEAQRIIQEMYQTSYYDQMLTDCPMFLQNTDFLNKPLKGLDWNDILIDLYNILELRLIVIQYSGSKKVQLDQFITGLKQMCVNKLEQNSKENSKELSKESSIQQYFDSFGQFYQLPIFQKIRLLKYNLPQNVQFIPFVAYQKKNQIYMDFDMSYDFERQDKKFGTFEIFQPYNRFFSGQNLGQCYVKYSQDVIDQMQFQQSCFMRKSK